MKYLQLLKIEHLDGGGYDVNSILAAIKTFSNWALRIGIAAAGLSLIIGFVLFDFHVGAGRFSQDIGEFPFADRDLVCSECRQVIGFHQSLVKIHGIFLRQQ